MTDVDGRFSWSIQQGYASISSWLQPCSPSARRVLHMEPRLSFLFFQTFDRIGWLPVPWFYPTEINTTRVRARMQAVASGWNWMAVFAVVKITPIAFGTKHSVENFYYLCRPQCFLPMVYCFYPITGSVLSSKGGRTVMPHQHAQEMQLDAKVGGVHEEVEDVQA
ncbi:hypothetical protein CEP54_010083 [Fusarium duplospermum]|uniref:Uncharacterized protein n=1 Tax=Fusarium duplospermum TaxID=1325734 RepID=A0A428PM35_9HYPO|nr:hypothetical protein CEP54_010083 [Fusarium duplospermum]